MVLKRHVSLLFYQTRWKYPLSSPEERESCNLFTLYDPSSRRPVRTCGDTSLCKAARPKKREDVIVKQRRKSVWRVCGKFGGYQIGKKVLSEDLWCNWRPAGFSTQHRWKLCVSLLQSRKWIHQTADGDVVIKLFTDAPEKHSPRWILKRETRQGMYEWSRDAQSSRCCRSCFFPFLTCCELKNLHVKRSGSDVRGMNIFKRCSRSWKCEDEEEETKHVSSSDSQPVRLCVSGSSGNVSKW